MMRVQVLDHGYLGLVETWGSDESVVEAARMSTGKGFLGWGPVCVNCNGSDVDVDGPEPYCRDCRDVTVVKPGDEKLLRYLWEHRHATPFEMAGMIIEVQAPIFVFREWHRHRTQCLSGSTEITLVSPRGASFTRTIRDIYEGKYGRPVGTGRECHRNGYSKVGTPVIRRARYRDPQHVGALPNCQSRLLRVIDEASGTAAVLPMADVWSSGMKEVFEVETSNGNVVRCSAAHPFFTRDGWAKVEDLAVGVQTGRYGKVAAAERPIPPALRSGIGVWTSMMRRRLIDDTDDCYMCGRRFSFDALELDHVEPVYLNLKRALDEDNLRPICGDCHKVKSATEQTGAKTRMGVRWDRITRIERVGEEETFDIEVGGPHHNFVANGLVVHNSYNEMSARYTPLPDVNYVPTVERLLLNAREGTRQAGTVAGAAMLDASGAEEFRRSLVASYTAAETLYQDALAAGVPKELARLHLPVGRYSRMRASANLRNWLAFLTLRMDKDAQWEIRRYANAVGQLIAARFPRTWALAGMQEQ